MKKLGSIIALVCLPFLPIYIALLSALLVKFIILPLLVLIISESFVVWFIHRIYTLFANRIWAFVCVASGIWSAFLTIFALIGIVNGD